LKEESSVEGIPLKAPSSFGEVPKSKLNWQGRLKSWKQSQISIGTILNSEEQKAKIMDSGISSILALLQAPIEVEQIQKKIENTYKEACKRAAGLKLICDFIDSESPFNCSFNDLLNWFSSALRHNKNDFTHFSENTIGQGITLENTSRKYFFEIL
jgi:hypothetical protein